MIALFLIIGVQQEVNAQACTQAVNAPTTINGISITQSSTGSVSVYDYSWTSCGYTTPANALHLGFTGPFTHTYNFSQPVNNLTIVITAAGGEFNENFIFTTNAGVTPSITDNGSCFSTIILNQIFSGEGSPDSSGGSFTITSATPFTSLTISGSGGEDGSLLALCSSITSCTGDITITTSNLDSDGSSNGTLQYAYTNEEGEILAIANMPTFANVPVGGYYVYAYYYKDSDPDWAVGRSIFDVLDDGCNNLAGPQFAGIGCACDDVIIELAGPIDQVVNFALVNPSTGNIEYLSTNGLFQSLSGTVYNAYVFQGTPPAGWAVGQPISALSGETSISGPFNAITLCCTDGFITLLKNNVQGCPNNILVDLKVFNEGNVDILSGTPITFYSSDPTLAGAAVLGTFDTTADVGAGAVKRFSNVDIGVCTISSENIYAVIGADGSEALPLNLANMLANAGYDDCDYTNNYSVMKINIACGKIVNIIQN